VKQDYRLVRDDHGLVSVRNVDVDDQGQVLRMAQEPVALVGDSVGALGWLFIAAERAMRAPVLQASTSIRDDEEREGTTHDRSAGEGRGR
jgi:hypothetical protein